MTTLKEFFNLFLLISAIQGILFFLFILFSKYKKARSIFSISFLVLVIALNNLQSWFITENYFPTIKVFQIPWHFLIAPFFYQFLVYYLDIREKVENYLKHQ